MAACCRTLIFLLAVSAAAQAAEPDYSAWNRILASDYSPAFGMDYHHLRQRDAAALHKVRDELGRVNVASLDRKQQEAYWINVYNVNVVNLIVENYPVGSIRDLSTDPIIRLNVFKKSRVPSGSALLSLDEVENDKLRDGFHDPRIHFAINCAARSCPPIRSEAYTGARLDAQLDEQVRRFLGTARFERKDGALVIHTTKILDWFSRDFDDWGGGKAQFVRRFVAPDKQRLIDAAHEQATFVYDDYDWSLNDWVR